MLLSLFKNSYEVQNKLNMWLFFMTLNQIG